MPMFLGLPSFCRVEARMPMESPTDTMPQRDWKNLFIRSILTPQVRILTPASAAVYLEDRRSWKKARMMREH